MDFKLFNAILSMDSYNRGYNSEIPVTGNSIGVATIVADSSILVDTSGSRLDVPRDFYAVAYNIGGAGTIIAYRGTDSALDALYGYGVGTGVPDVDQGVLAFGFYRAVAGTVDSRMAQISVTGHSLGGGLAGANDNSLFEERYAA